MKKYLFLTLFSVTAATMWFACKKDNALVSQTVVPEALSNNGLLKADPTVLKDLKIENGVLHFSEGDKAFEQYSAILAMSDVEFETWATANHFMSQSMLVNDINELLDAAKTQGEFDSILEDNKDLVVLESDEVVARVSASLYSRITPRSGIYFAGESAFKITDDFLIEARDGELAKLANVSPFTKSDPDNNLYVYSIYSSEEIGERDGGCGPELTAYCTQSNRRVDFVIKIVNCYGCCGGVRKQIVIDVYGKKKNIFNKYVSYNTILSFEHVGYQIRDQFGTIQSYDNWAETSSGEVSEFHGYNWIDPQPCYSNCQSGNIFLKAKGTGDSRGLPAGYWALICCGYTNGNGCPPPSAPGCGN